MADLPNWRDPQGRARITEWLTAAGHDMTYVWHVELEDGVAKLWRVGQPSAVVPLPQAARRPT